MNTSSAHRASQVLLSLADAFAVNPLVHSLKKEFNSVGAISTRHNGNSALPMASANTNSQPNSGKFVPLSGVRSIRDLSLELKASANSKLGLQVDAPRTTTASSRNALLEELNLKLQNFVDRNEFRRQMELSRVVGKEVDLSYLLLLHFVMGYTSFFPFLGQRAFSMGLECHQ